jgi:hypothetical protein
VKYRAGHTLRRAGKTAGNYGKELFLCVLFDAKKRRERELDKDKKVSRRRRSSLVPLEHFQSHLLESAVLGFDASCSDTHIYLIKREVSQKKFLQEKADAIHFLHYGCGRNLGE